MYHEKLDEISIEKERDIRLHSDQAQQMPLLRLPRRETQPSLAVPFDIKLQHQRQRTVRHLALKSCDATWPSFIFIAIDLAD